MVTLMSRVLLKSLTKHFADVVAVDSVDLEVQDQELLVLVGPSGCGKSSMVRMSAGFADVTSGEITIGNRLVNRVAAKDRNISMVFQNYALYPHMNVFRNMAFGLQMRKVSREEIDQRVRDTAQILGIEALLTRRPAPLSGGQRQRIAIARAIILRPKIIVLDEPTSALDVSVQSQIVDLLRDLQRLHNLAYLFISHDLKVVRALAHELVVMKDGKIVEQGPAEKVFSSPETDYTKALMAAAFELETV